MFKMLRVAEQKSQLSGLTGSQNSLENKIGLNANFQMDADICLHCSVEPFLELGSKF